MKKPDNDNDNDADGMDTPEYHAQAQARHSALAAKHSALADHHRQLHGVAVDNKPRASLLKAARSYGTGY